MSDVATCRTCGLPRFNGPAGYAGAQCLCQWKGATLPQMYDELMAKNAALEAENARLTAQLAAIQGGMGEPIEPCTDLNHHERYRAGWNACLAQHQRITAAMAAECDRLREQVKALQSDANSWQSGYDKGRADGYGSGRKERDALRAELAEVTSKNKD